jgi:hypothetical protein
VIEVQNISTALRWLITFDTVSIFEMNVNRGCEDNAVRRVGSFLPELNLWAR